MRISCALHSFRHWPAFWIKNIGNVCHFLEFVFYSSLHNVNKYSTLITCVYGTAFGGSNSHFWDILHIYLSSTRIWCKWTLKLLSLRLFNFFSSSLPCFGFCVSLLLCFSLIWSKILCILNDSYIVPFIFFFCVSCQFDKLVHKETFVFFFCLDIKNRFFALVKMFVGERSTCLCK